MRVDVRVLGGFSVDVDGRRAASPWRRQASTLVKLLVSTPSARLHRERVMHALWPDVALDEATPRLHKAAHFARRTLGHDDAVVLRDEVVSLFPGATITVDARTFEAAAAAALRSDRDALGACAAAIALYPGTLLPDDLYEPWCDEWRSRLEAIYRELLRRTARWESVLAVEPADEQAHLELLRAAVVSGDRVLALRRYGTMERVLRDELGLTPGPEAVALRERIVASSTVGEPGPAGRPATPSPPAMQPRARPPLLERDQQLEELAAIASTAVDAGRGSVVLVAGEAGSGKTALVGAFLDRLPAGVRTAVGGCDDLLAPRSLGPFRDIAAARPEWLSEPSSDDPDAMLNGLLRFIASVPTVVVIEDVHWADDATIDAIRYLSRRLPGLPAVLLLTLREDEVDRDHALRPLLGALASGAVHRVEPKPLSVDAVRQLTSAGDAAILDAEELHRATKGNPFFVTEVVASAGDRVPASVRDAVLARIAKLDAPTRALVEHVAVVPARAERWLAEELAGGPEAVVQAERSGILVGDPEHVSFGHELARRAVESSLTAGERLQMNARVLAALLDRPGVEPSRIVHHAHHAGRGDVLRARAPAAAAAAARAGAHRQAAEMLRLALDHGDGLDAATAADLLTRRAYSLYVVNQFDAAFECGQRAVRAAEEVGDRTSLVDALLVLAKSAYWAQGPGSARDAAKRALALIELTDDRGRLAASLIDVARSTSNLATVGVVAEPSAEAAAFAERALELADQLERDDLRSQALCYLGSSRLACGDERGAADLERAIAISSNEPRAEFRVRIYVNAAGAAYRAARRRDAERYVAAGLRLAPDCEFLAGEYRLRLTAAAIHATAGESLRAIGELTELVDSADGPGVMRPLACALLARLLARRGDTVAARDVLEPALQHPAAALDSYVAGPLATAQLEIAWLSGTASVVPGFVEAALALATAAAHRAVQGELCTYLRRSGHEVVAPADVPEPWAAALAGRWSDAAAGWAALGERYEHAIELAWSGDHAERRAEGLVELDTIGASAAASLVRARRPRVAGPDGGY